MSNLPNELLRTEQVLSPILVILVGSFFLEPNCGSSELALLFQYALTGWPRKANASLGRRQYFLLDGARMLLQQAYADAH